MSHPPHQLRAALGRARTLLPRGQTLPDKELWRRHRALLALLWFHAAALPAWGLVRGHGLAHSLGEGAIVATIAAAATLAGDRQRVASPLVALGLLTSSAVLVHLSGGAIEAHFHFFVVIVALTLYEQWLPFLLAVAFVVLHHGIGGTIVPQAVYDHPDAAAHPWRWAAIHAGFVAAAGLVAIVAWRLNEDVRLQKERLLADQQAALERALAAERELELRARELQRSNQELEQFAAIASHDLSEPLRTVSSFVELLRSRYHGRLDAQADEFIGYAVDGTRRMQSLIDDLLAYSRVGRAELVREPVDLNAVVEQTLAGLRTAVERTGAQVTVDRLPVVHGDARQLGQLLQNLLSNAMKFTGDRPPRMRVTARPADGAWEVSVVDNGIGIDPAAAERVFKMFQRLQARDAYEGTGIGLAICQRIVERHGGRIWVEPAPGGGSAFRFTVPDVPGTSRAAGAADRRAAAA